MKLFVIVLLAFSLNSYGQDSNYLEFSGRHFIIDSLINKNLTHFGFGIPKDSSFYFQTPGLTQSVGHEVLLTGNIIFLDVPEDSVQVDFNMGKLSIGKDNSFKDFELNIFLGGQYCHSDNMEVIFINKDCKSYRVGVVEDINFLLSIDFISKPKYLIIRNIHFSNSKLADGYLSNSFLWEVE